MLCNLKHFSMTDCNLSFTHTHMHTLSHSDMCINQPPAAILMNMLHFFSLFLILYKTVTMNCQKFFKYLIRKNFYCVISSNFFYGCGFVSNFFKAIIVVCVIHHFFLCSHHFKLILFRCFQQINWNILKNFILYIPVEIKF